MKRCYRMTASAMSIGAMFAIATPTEGSNNVTSRLEWPVFGVFYCSGEGTVTGTFVASPVADGSWNVSAKFRPKGAHLTCHDGMPGDGGTWTAQMHGLGVAEFNTATGILVTVVAEGLHWGSGQNVVPVSFSVYVIVGTDGVVSIPLAPEGSVKSGLLSASTSNPFEGSWAGTYEVIDLGGGGVVDFTISKTGVLKGHSVNNDGTGHTLLGRVNAEGYMLGVAIFENGGPTEQFSGQCSIQQNGNLVCELTGCIQTDCFDFTVTVSPHAITNQAIGIDNQLNGEIDLETGEELAAPSSGAVTTQLNLPQCDGRLRVKFVASPAPDGSWNVSVDVRPSSVEMALHHGIDPGSGEKGTLKGVGTAEFAAGPGIPIGIYAFGLRFQARFSGTYDAAAAISLSVGDDGVVSVSSHSVSINCIFCGVSCNN